MPHFWIILVWGILGCGVRPVLAQDRPQRYPTEAEIQQIIREFQQRASSKPYSRKCCGGWEEDKRRPAEKQPLESFVNAWSKVEPGIAAFLGGWVNNDGEIGVYPSNIPGRVCVIDVSPALSYKFSVGSLSNRQIRLRDDWAGRVLLT